MFFRSHSLRVLGTLASAALCDLSLAQDSVSRNANGGNGLPGDALPAFSASSQRTSFVVDLVPLTTSWGTRFGIAPILKSGRPSVAANFNAFNGPSAISKTIRSGVPYPSPSYSFWNQATAGISLTDNNTALNSTLSPSGSASVFALGVLDFEEITVGTTLVFTNQIVGGLVAFDPAAPTRLYVSRIVAANNSTAGQPDRSQFGFGAIDSHGNITFRADSLLSAGTTNLLPGDNYFRVRLPLRAPSINLIDSTGGSDAAATNWVLNNASVTHTTPNAIPQDVAGRPVILGANFITQIVRESTPGSTTPATNHRPNTTDHRGGPSYSPVLLFPGSIGSSAILSRSTGTRTDSISVTGLSADGDVVGARTLTVPASISDACNAAAWPIDSGEFRGYDSQVTFRGGSAQAAVGKDQTGRALAAAILYSGSGGFAGSSSNPFNAIAAVRFDASNPNSIPQWTVVAWTNTLAMNGKDILGDFGADGVPGTNDAGEGDGVVNATDAPIGRLASFTELALGRNGPSISAPAIDSVGNIYFIASVALRKLMGNQVVLAFDHALLRAVYDPATFCYRLELVARIGDSFPGANSARSYRIASIGLADADSIASSSLWPGNISAQAWNNIPAAPLRPSDPQTLGGLALSARIIYDVNADGLFQDPTQPGGNPASTDEAYNVILYLSNISPPRCTADVDDGTGSGLPDGGVTIDDLLYYLVQFDLGNLSADIDDGSGTGTPDGGVTIDDLLYYLQRFDLGC